MGMLMRLGLRNPITVQALRDALRHADDGNWLGVYVSCIEQDQITGTVDGIEGVDRKIAIILTTISSRDECGLSSHSIAEVVANNVARLRVDLHHGIESGRRRVGDPKRVGEGR